MAMKTFYDYYTEWKTIKETRNIGPQTEAILCVFFNIPCFFSRAELRVFLGCKSPNHNVDEDLTKMVEERMIVKATNKVGTEIYYHLGHFGMEVLGHDTLPDYDTRQVKYIESITIRLENGERAINSRHRATRDKSHQHRKSLRSLHLQRRVDPT
jgi:hypothetical protein